MVVIPLPSNWKEFSLAEMADIVDSRRVPLNAAQRASRTGPYPYYGANGQVDSIDDYIFDGDYILLAEDGGYFDDPLRKVAYLVSGRFWVNNHAHILKPREGFDVRFLMHQLNTVQWMEYVSGTTRLKLTQSALLRVRLRAPQIEEQRRIVTRIEEMRDRSRRAHEALLDMPILLERLGKATRSAALQGYLTSAWRSQHGRTETAQGFLSQTHEEQHSRRQAGEEAKPNHAGRGPCENPATVVLTRLPQLPSGWAWVRAEELCSAIRRGTTPKSVTTSPVEDAVPFLKVGNLSSVGDLNLEKDQFFIPRTVHEGQMSKTRSLPGDVVMSIVGPPLGKAAVLTEQRPEWNVNQAIAVFKLLGGYSSYLFCQSLLAESAIRYLSTRAKATAGQFNLNLQDCRDLPVPVPPPEEQAAVEDSLKTALGQVLSLAAVVQATQTDLQKLEAAILRKAFSGEL